MVHYDVSYTAVEYSFVKRDVVYHLHENKDVQARDINDLRAKLLKEYKVMLPKYGKYNFVISVSTHPFHKGHITMNKHGIYWEDYPGANRYHIYPNGRVKYDIRYHTAQYM